MPCRSRVLHFFPSNDGDKPPLEFVCLFLYILYFSSYDSDNPPLEFVCPFLYILYFPHTMSEPFLKFVRLLLCIPHTKANTKKISKLFIMLIEHTY
jgi:hypothetical protein